MPELRTKILRRLAFLPGLTVGILAGLLVTVPLGRHRGAPPAAAQPESSALDVARLSPAELEALALNVLTTLDEKRGRAAEDGPDVVKESRHRPGENLRSIHLGMENIRRLLPLAKKLTLQSLGDSLKTSRLSRERRLLNSVRRVVLEPGIGGTAEVWEEDLSVIHVGPDYATWLTSDDDAMLLLGHELTHVAARGGRLKHFIEGVSELARQSADLELGEYQREELACDFTGAEVLKRYIALRPTGEGRAERFSRAFGYEPHSERLAQAWKDFCASYNGGPVDEEHLNQYQTFRALLGLDPELKELIPEDATSTQLCR